MCDPNPLRYASLINDKKHSFGSLQNESRGTDFSWTLSALAASKVMSLVIEIVEEEARQPSSCFRGTGYVA